MRSSAALALALAWVAACGHAGEEATIATPPRVPDRIAPGVPHGGAIIHVAITEQGDAALSLDGLGELRLWPSLDGKRPPVPLAAADADRVALGYAGEDLLAAILDHAGSIRLVRVGRDGTIRGHATIPGDVACVEVVAIDGGVLVVRADESIERYDAAGTLHGRIVPGAGETIGSIAARAGSAAALIVTPAQATLISTPVTPTNGGGARAPALATTMRWIVVRDDLRWGTSVPLATPVVATTFALSPNHRRVAVIDGPSSALAVLDLAPLPRAHAGPTIPASATSIIGFGDDDHCALVDTAVRWWTPTPEKPDPDPWAVQRPSAAPLANGSVGGAIGDGVAIMGYGPSLAIVDYERPKWLGWKTVGASGVTAIGSKLAVPATNTHAIWLDDRLVEVGESDFATVPRASQGTFAGAVWIDEHHAVAEVSADGKVSVLLIDTVHPEHPTTIVALPAIERIVYQRELGVLAIGTPGQVARYEIDLAQLAAKALPVLRTSAQLQNLWLLDPARSDGLVAITSSYEQDGPHIQLYRDGSAAKVRPTKELSSAGAVVTVDRSGTIYTLADNQLVLHHEGRADTKLAHGGQALDVSHDLQRLAVVENNVVSLVDRAGTVYWQHPLWGMIAVAFTTDDHRVIAQTAGGIVALDATTGERVASACGFGFGVVESPPAVNTLGVTPICDETR